MRTRTITATTLLALALTACGSNSSPSTTASNQTSTTATTSAPASKPMNAEQVIKTITETVTDAKAATIYTAATDPNNLLGRPGGYTSKGDFTDQRAKPKLDDEVQNGGSVEVYEDPATAEKRSKYITRILADVPAFGTEYHYLKDGILLRVSGALTPEQGAEYETALKQLG